MLRDQSSPRSKIRQTVDAKERSMRMVLYLMRLTKFEESMLWYMALQAKACDRGSSLENV
jgi:hypothetical protein